MPTSSSGSPLQHSFPNTSDTASSTQKGFTLVSTSDTSSVSSDPTASSKPKWWGRHNKVALCLPWYAGSDPECVATHLTFQHYLGRLQERLLHRNPLNPARLPPLDPVNTTGFSEIPQDFGNTTFEFAISEEIKCSLVGTARQRTIEAAMTWGADYVLFYDADMLFGTDIFLRLLMSNKPLVGALAFTGREPITPVIYRFKDWSLIDHAEGKPKLSFTSDVVHDYEPNALQQVDAVGFGVVLIDTDVFRVIPAPWFGNETSRGVGEDIYLCALARLYGIPVYVNTAAKTIHKPTFHTKWHDERAYLAHMRAQAESAA